MTSRLVAALVLVAVAAGARAADLSGTWKLDREASRIEEGVAYAGLGGNEAIPRTLYVTQASNGTVLVGSDMNTSHVRTYLLDRETRAPLANGEVTMLSRRQDGALVSEGETPSGATLRETVSRADDGSRLTVEIEQTTGEGARSARLVYRRADREDPCQDWPTPCRDWSELASPSP